MLIDDYQWPPGLSNPQAAVLMTIGLQVVKSTRSDQRAEAALHQCQPLD